MNNIVRIGNAQGFWGDSPGAAARLAQQQPDLDYLTLDYLAELSLSIMAIQREKDPSMGYARDFVEVVRSLTPLWKKGSQLKIVTNAGGLNPLACAQACQRLLQQERLPQIRIGVVSGDDLLSLMKTNPQNHSFENLETHESLIAIQEKLVTANAYLGAKPIVQALSMGAHIVITGRTADPSLTVAPCAAHFNWSLDDDYDRLAGATIAGHLIECGTQVTGGISTDWLQMPDPAHLGFPIVEVDANGDCVITKPLNTGGKVTINTVKEQLLYEVGDPDHYLSPDATVSFLSLTLKEVGENRIHISGAKGNPPPPSYKVSATYRDGFKAEAYLAIFGVDAQTKARRCGEIILQRVREAGYDLQRTIIECLGAGAIAPGVVSSAPSMECVLRIAAADSRQEALDCFAKEIAPMVTSGPQGVSGYSSGRPHIRPVFGYWPCLVARDQISPIVQILEASR